MAIALLTDFGTSSPYVGVLKGVIHKLAPEAAVIDVTHSIHPYDVLEAAFCLNQCYSYFPDGTIFVAVVDPGVGTERKPIMARTKHYYFIAPDNGLLTRALHEQEDLSLFHLNKPHYHLSQVSHTFHGRDIFAPVAAHLAQGVDLLELGDPLQDYEKKTECFPQTLRGKLEGQIISIDPFGNAISNISQSDCERTFKGRPFILKLKGRKRDPLKRFCLHYGQAEPGEVLMLFGSSGFLEIAQNQGNAARAWKLERGQKIQLSPA